MKRPTAKTWLLRAVVTALAASGLLLSWSFERQSVERANRLHRTGALNEAAALYGGQVQPEDIDPTLRYNLGTSLLELGSVVARDELEAAGASEVVDVQARAFYNSGLLSLREALDDAAGDSLWARAEAAVDANRRALLLRPEHQDTKWNLAMAQRLLDSLEMVDGRAGREAAESSLEADEVEQSENVLELDEEQELPEDAPMEGEDETRADLRDNGGMSQSEAAEILSSSHLDPTLIVRKLLALESRGFWGRRLGVRGPRR